MDKLIISFVRRQSWTDRVDIVLQVNVIDLPRPILCDDLILHRQYRLLRVQNGCAIVVPASKFNVLARPSFSR